jgi:hypothetical protein
MTEPHESIDPHFFQLILSLQAGAMQQMGKIASPISGKIERNLEMARHNIDIINMLNTKMEGNLTKEESEFLKHILYELRLNYVDEVKKEETKKAEAEPAEKDTVLSQSETEPKQADVEPESSKPGSSDNKNQ